jgi:hypothetical protein
VSQTKNASLVPPTAVAFLNLSTAMLQLGHISACISVEGVKLQPYGVEVSASGTSTSCWIASEAGKASPTTTQKD